VGLILADPDHDDGLGGSPLSRTVRVFISSTFKDMHAERDRLVRFVFPELRERCARRRLHLVDVDLRWGVTEEAAEQGRVLEVCLDEIERCRFFIGLLGERYGSIPDRYEVLDEPRYDWLRTFAPGHSMTALEIYHGALRNPAMAKRAFFYLRDPKFLETVPDTERWRFVPESEAAAQKLRNLKESLKHKSAVREYSHPDDTFQQMVLEDLWAAIQAEHPEEEQPPDELALERSYHEAFLSSRSRRLIGRQDLINELFQYAEGGESVCLVVSGEAGTGKSALLASFARSYAASHPGAFVLPHFVGASPGSTDIRRTMLRLCRELAQHFGLDREAPEEYEKLRAVFPLFLEEAAGSGTRIIVVIDALSQLQATDRAQALDWLPHRLPPGVLVVVSTLSGPTLDTLRARKRVLRELTMGCLPVESRREVVQTTLREYRKELSQLQMDSLLGKRESGTPLFLTIACEELRLFSQFESVTERIAALPDDVPALLEQVLERLEDDQGRDLVASALSLLACSRYGLLETELLGLLRREGEVHFARALWARLYRSLALYVSPAGSGQDMPLGLFHAQLTLAVQSRYLKTEEQEQEVHQRLARYSMERADLGNDRTWHGTDQRAFDVLPFHALRSGRSDLFREIVLDYGFIATKTRLLGAPAVLADLDLLQPDTAGAPDALVLARDALRLSLEQITGNAELLPSQVCGRLVETRVSEIDRLICNVAPPFPWLRPLTRALVQAGSPLLAQIPVARGCRRLLISPDSTRAISVDGEHRLTVWDLEAALPIRTISPAPEHEWLDIAAAGSYGLTHHRHGSPRQLWDLESGQVIREGHDASQIESSTDGMLSEESSAGAGRLLCASGDSALLATGDFLTPAVSVFSLTQGVELRSLAQVSAARRAAAVGGTALITTEDGALAVWDLTSGQKKMTLCSAVSAVRSRGEISELRLSASGKRAVTVDSDGIRIWRLDQPDPPDLAGHHGAVRAIAIGETSALVASGGDDWTIKLWEAGSGTEAGALKVPRSIESLTMSEDGRWLAGLCGDALFRVWDLTSRRVVGTLALSTLAARAVGIFGDLGEILLAAGDQLQLVSWQTRRRRSMAKLPPDAQHAVTSTRHGPAFYWYDAGSVFCWRRDRGPQKLLSVHSDTKPVLMAASAESDRIALWWAGGDRRGIELWDGPSGTLLRQAQRQPGARNILVLSSSGLQIAASSGGSFIEVFHADGATSAAFRADADLSAAAFTGRDDLLCLGDVRGGVHFLRLTPAATGPF